MGDNRNKYVVAIASWVGNIVLDIFIIEEATEEKAKLFFLNKLGSKESGELAIQVKKLSKDMEVDNNNLCALFDVNISLGEANE